jgi:hypothetical protein
LTAPVAADNSPEPAPRHAKRRAALVIATTAVALLAIVLWWVV